MEIPHELMITIRQKHPWMFFPDIVPIGHPIFDIINSTDPEVIITSLKVVIFVLKVFSLLTMLHNVLVTERLGSQVSVSSAILF